MKILGIALALTLAAGLAVAAFLHRPSTTERPSEPPTSAHVLETGAKPLGVDELMRNVERIKGEVTLEGIVSTVSSDKSALALIDCAEYSACHSTTCAELVLPVRWTGAMPLVRAKVLVKGAIEKTPAGLIFVAQEVRSSERQEPAPQ